MISNQPRFGDAVDPNYIHAGALGRRQVFAKPNDFCSAQIITKGKNSYMAEFFHAEQLVPRYHPGYGSVIHDDDRSSVIRAAKQHAARPENADHYTL